MIRSIFLLPAVIMWVARDESPQRFPLDLLSFASMK
jgi:hypothetical protein